MAEPKSNADLIKELLDAIREAPTLGKAALSVAEMCEYLGIKKKTLYNQLSAGTFPIPYRKVGNKPIWSKKVVDAWLEGRK